MQSVPVDSGTIAGQVEVAIVPHTHWDREWYEPFQTYRIKLVHLVDALLDLLDQDPSYTRFLLDGQTSVIDDYLEIRPEQHARLEHLAGAGRIQVGPWMILMDEFMVSGETIVRNLQLGIERAEGLGPAALLRVGYLPDMFGHIAQMPQLLRLAGLDHAVVWRGVPSEVNSTAFWWQAPDGSRVRAEYLYGSYSNGRELPDDPEQLVARARGYETELGDARLPGGDILLMNGSDHLLPQHGLGATVERANAIQSRYHFAITSLDDYVRAQPCEGLITWAGELRSGARANVLMGVASNRVDVHQIAAAAERAVERVGEPLSALLLPADRYPDAFLRIAWRHLVLDSAHDSSCACSHDEVVEAVRVRYEEARHIGAALTRDALHQLAAEVVAPPGSTIVVNPTAVARDGLVAVPLPGEGPVHLVALDGTACATQLVRTVGGEGISTVVVGRKVQWVVEMMRGPELAGARIARVEHERLADGTVEVTFHDAGPGEPSIDLEATREQLVALGEAGATISIRQRRAPVREVVFAAGAVPGFGWRTYRAAEGAGPDGPVRAEGSVMANDHVHVEIDRGDGTMTLEADGVRVAGINRYVDGGDGGDTYNYSPPALDTVVDRPDAVVVEVLEAGPVRARVLVTTTYTLPSHAIGDERECATRSSTTVPTEIRTILELRAGERYLRVHVELDNHVRDHRLRAHFPLPARVDVSEAECAFAVVQRALTVEGGPHEVGLPTFVSRRFVDCTAVTADDTVGLALVHDGLLEYEVVADGREVALTLLRATGYLSRSRPALRPNPAGPLDPLEGPQLQQRVAMDYAVVLHRGNWRAARIADIADEVLVPLERVRGGGWAGAHRPATGALLQVEGAQVSAVRRASVGGPLEVRLHNPTPDPVTARVAIGEQPARGEVVDLTGRVVGPFTGNLALGASEITTLRLSDRAQTFGP